MTLKCRDTKLWSVSGCIKMSQPLGAEPLNGGSILLITLKLQMAVLLTNDQLISSASCNTNHT
jgi:hypothetical protein